MEVTIFASAVQSSTYRLRADIFQHWFFSAWTHNLSLGKNNKSNNQVLFSPLIFAACSLADKEKVGRLFSLRVSCVLVLLITHTESQQACAHVCACVCTSVHLVVSCSVCTDHTDHNQLPQSQASGSPGTFTQAKNRQKKRQTSTKSLSSYREILSSESFNHLLCNTEAVTQEAKTWNQRQSPETRARNKQNIEEGLPEKNVSFNVSAPGALTIHNNIYIYIFSVLVSVFSRQLKVW